MPWEQIGEFALGNGVLGVAVLVLGFVVWQQYKEGRACEKARLDDAKATIPVLESASRAMAAITVEMASRTTVAAGMGEAIRGLQEAQEQTADRLDKIHELLLRDSGRRGRP